MLAKSRNFKHGNVSAQPIGGSPHNIARIEPRLPMVTSFNISKLGTGLSRQQSEPVKTNSQKKVEPFDTTTGIISNSPEVISFGKFIPPFDDAGNLNEFGELLQVKQDAILSRAAGAITNIAVQQQFAQMKPQLDSNIYTIKVYCDSHAANIDELLTHFSTIRSKLYFGRDRDLGTLKEIGALPPDVDLSDENTSVLYANKQPLQLKEILNDGSFVNWTSTKTWLQSCMELKEMLANGMPSSFLADGAAATLDPTDTAYYDPYSLVRAKSTQVKKFGFNAAQSLTYPIDAIARINDESLSSAIVSIAAALNSNDTSSGIFSGRVFSDINNIEESIAKISHVLCREFMYSTRLRSDVLADYGYPFNFGGRNVGVWNYLIGQIGADITDITASPLGGGKSLVSLSQTVEPEGTEVLSFEDMYVNDNVGTVRPNAVMTPGTFYYLESSINPTTSGFDVSRINRYLTRLNSATNMLSMVRNDLAFDDEVAHSTVVTKITGNQEEGVDDRRRSTNSTKLNLSGMSDATVALTNPIRLLRHIENKVMSGMGLLRRESGPKLWTNSNKEDIDEDVSPLLISLALEKDDAELQALLFLHQVYSFSSNKVVPTDYNRTIAPNPSDTIVKSQIVDRIVEKIRVLLGRNSSTLRQRGLQEASVSLSVVRQALLSTSDSPALKSLHRIGALIADFDGNFDYSTSKSKTNGRFFIEQSRTTILMNQPRSGTVNPPPDKKSSYSGISKTNYLLALFKLCCLLVHAANPERITSIKSPASKYLSDDYLVVSKIKSATMGVLLASNQIDSGIASIHIQEDLRNFDALRGSRDVPSRIKSLDAPSYDIRKLNVKPPLKVFEVPSIQAGIRVFDSSRPEKKFRGSFDSPKDTNTIVLHYDDAVVKAEHLLADYDAKFRRIIDRFYAFVYDLRGEFSKLKNNLQLKSGNYGRTLSLLSRQLANPNLIRAVMSEEQLMLIRSKMYDISTRLTDYSSPLRSVTPHFSSLQNNDAVEYALPFEDMHLISWNLFLKQFLRNEGYRYSDGVNKKILSIGIPQKLQRRMRVDASRLNPSARTKRNLININVYRVNAFKPDVVYLPKSYIFDTKVFPTRVLSNYTKAGFKLSDLEDLTSVPEDQNVEFNLSSIISSIPFLRAVETGDGTNYIRQFAGYELIQEYLRDYGTFAHHEQSAYDLLKNHVTSLFMEEYLRLVTDLRFDENKYHHYGEISSRSRSKFSKFVSEFTGLNARDYLSASNENFFQDESLFTNVETTVRDMILPKKFDRVFHVVVDPDDFEIDTDKTSIEVVNKYAPDGDVSKIIKTQPDEPSFDKFYVSLESVGEGGAQ
jgi:hypothetical protein